MMKCQAVLTEDIPYRTYSYGIDNTKLPIRVRKSARSNQVITAWLTIVLDLYSRTIVAYAIKETSPNAEDILAVLAEAFAVTETPDGLFGGLPGRLRSDNGGDFTSNAVRDALFDLGVIHDRSMVYTPRQNGRVERTNGIIKKRFAPDQPGYAKGADTDLELAMRRSPADIDSLMTLDELNDAFGKWVDEKYHHLKHPELAPLTRLQVWHGSPQPLKEVEEETLWAAMLRRDKRPLHRYGIEIHKSYFQHPELATLWSHSKRKIVLDVRSSRRYPDRIFVFNDGVFLCTAYRAKAMTDEQKGIIRGQHKGQTDKAATYLNEANHARAIEAQEDARIANAQRERATGSTARSPERFDLFDDLDDLEFTDLPNDRKEAS
jgi:transposase InsO family protein